jgi:Tol biopolymer transport system component
MPIDQGSAGFPTEIEIVDVASGAITQLTHDRYGRLDLSWSPDGTRLVYETGVMSRATAQIDVATGLISYPPYSYPVWSPGGRKIAYLGNDGLNVALADGSNPRLLVPVNQWNEVLDPSWSPDSRSLVFSDGPANYSWHRLEIVDVQNGRVRPITPGHPQRPTVGWQWLDGPKPSPFPSSHQELAPAWSPDGRWIAFARSGRHGNIAVIHPNGRGLRVFPLADLGSIRWEPEGN